MFDKEGYADVESRESEFNTLIRRINVQLKDKYGSRSNSIRQLRYGYEDVIGRTLEKSSRGSKANVSRKDFMSIMTKAKVSFQL